MAPTPSHSDWKHGLPPEGVVKDLLDRSSPGTAINEPVEGAILTFDSESLIDVARVWRRKEVGGYEFCREISAW